MNIAAGDAWWQPPDFCARIWIDGIVFRTPTVVNSHGFTLPAGWSFTRNVSRAKHGGPHNHGAIELTHVTITGDQATFSRSESVGGGGLYNAGNATAKLSNVTIAGNSSESNANGIALGGGIAGPGVFTLRNTVIAGNTVGAGFSNCGLGTPLNIIDEGGNLQLPGSDCGRWITFTPPRRMPVIFWRTFFTAAACDAGAIGAQ